jgi:hypothetical protein
MKRLGEVWNSIGSRLRPRLELPESAARTLGFQPAVLDVATMRIYPWRSPEGCSRASNTVIAGFERGGFFYTRRAAARACKEWGFGG